MSFNWPEIPFTGAEVEAFVNEYKIVAEELYYNYSYDSLELLTPYVNKSAFKKYLEYGLIYAAFIVKQRAGNSGPGTDFDLNNSPYSPTDAMNTPEKRKKIMENLGCVFDPGEMIVSWQENKENDPSLDPYDELGPEDEPWKGPVGDLMDALTGLGATNPDDECNGFYARYENINNNPPINANGPLWSVILNLGEKTLGFLGGASGYLAVQLLRRYLEGTGGVFTENSVWGLASKSGVKNEIKNHINFWKNNTSVVQPLESGLTASSTWRTYFGLSESDVVFRVAFANNFTLASCFGTATVVLSGDPVFGDFEVKRLIDDYDFFYGWEVVRSFIGNDFEGAPINDLSITSGANRKTTGNKTGPCDPNTTVCNAIDREGIHWAIRFPVAGSFGPGCYDKWEDHPNAEDSGKPFSININFANI